MPTFRYEPLTPGPTAASTVEAPDRAAALRMLRGRGVVPVRIEQVSRSAARVRRESARASGAAKPVQRRRISRGEMAMFVRELATAVNAGLPLVQALRTIARSGRSETQRAMLGHLIDEVEHGRSLGDAAESWGRPFTRLTVDLIHAGESAGRLGEVLDQCAELLDRDVKLRRALLSATLYPAILILLVIGAVLVIVTFVVPAVLEPLQDAGATAADLPLPTRIVQGVADVVGGYWWAILGAIALLVWGWVALYRSPGPRLAIDRFALRVPVLGRLLRDVAVARFTRTLGTLISAGLPALHALRVTKSTLNNRAMEAVVDDACEQVASGRTISEPLEASGAFPPLLVQLVSVGERTGRLAPMLRQAADAFEGRTEQSIKLFISAFPPLLIVVMAAIVGFVVAAVLLPLLELSEMIG